MKHDLPTIAGFWYGSDLSWLEALCIQSFLDHGHRFVLYLADDVKNVPPGVETRPASDILWPSPFSFNENERHRVAVFSDIFRLHLSQKTDYIWVDLDAFCVRPFDVDTPYVFGQSRRGDFPTGVLRLPKSSETLASMLSFVDSPNPTQPWRGPTLRRANRRKVANGERWGIEHLPWGCSGPKAFTHFLIKTGESIHTSEPEIFYPLSPDELWMLHAPEIRTQQIERSGVLSVHIYGHQKREMALSMSGLPSPGSYLDRMCKRHGITPRSNPITRLSWMGPTTNLG
ncbi:hypothetical protein [Ruegeria sp.]|uniref:hypothetical protein n=1 Tax=Ruegeria sp. TaxID=1879320 RepID=UPI003C7C7460